MTERPMTNDEQLAAWYALAKDETFEAGMVHAMLAAVAKGYVRVTTTDGVSIGFRLTEHGEAVFKRDHPEIAKKIEDGILRF